MNLATKNSFSGTSSHHPVSLIRQTMHVGLRVAYSVSTKLAGFLFVALLLTFSAFAQFTSNLQGVVTDASGAMIPNASLTLENEKTGTKLTGTSNSSGNYRFNSLAPGTFRLTAKAEGFSTKTVETLLTTEQTAGVDLQLTPGAATEIVNVSSTTGPLLNPDETRLQVTVNKSQIDELPLQNRNIYSIVTIAPGVTGFANAGSSDDFANENKVQASANGHYAAGNQYVLDGFSITSAVTGGTANISPNPDSVEEAALQTNTFAVDQGQGSSVQVELTTRSGTNTFHGAVNYQYSDNNLQRFGYFQRAYNPFRRHDVSVAIGGPLWKDHLFFFGSTEIKRRLVGASTGNLFAETPAFLAYGRSINPNGLGVSLLSQYPTALVNTQPVATFTSGKVLGCKNGINTDTGNLGCNIPFIVSGQNPRATPDNGRQYNFRIDGTRPSGKDRVYFNYYNTTNTAGVILARPGFDVATTLTSFFLSANYTHTFGDRLLNQVSFSSYGVDGYQARGGTNYNVPVISINQINTPLGILNGPGFFEQRNYAGRDVLSYIRGKQSFTFGGALRHENDKADFAARLARPTFTFQTVQELLTDNPLIESGVTFAPLTGLQKLDRFGGQDTLFSFFASDNYKVTPHLLLSIGLRYDDFGNVTPYGFPSYKQTANVLLGAGSDYVTQIVGAHTVLSEGVYNGRRSGNISPRGSFAYAPFPTLSIRGGAGLYLDEIGIGQVIDRVNTNPPNFSQPNFDRRISLKPVFSIGTVKTAEVSTTTPNPFGFTLPIFPGGVDAKGGVPGVNASVNAIDPNLKLPKSINYVFGGEQSLGKSTVIGLNYSGSYLYDQLIGPNQNRAPGDLNLTTGLTTLPNTSFGPINRVINGGYGHYDALIATLRQSRGQWVSYEASYTWSHSRDTGISGLRSTLSNGITIEQDDYPDPTNLNRYYASSSFDTRNRITVAGYVKTPYKHQGFVLKQLLDNYELSTISVGQSGQPFSVFNSNAYKVVNGVNVGGDYQGQGYNYAFPNQPITNYARPRTKAEYVNGLFTASEFTAPPVGVFVQGTETRNHYTNPALLNIDASVIKGFTGSLADHVLTLKVRGDFYNVINRTNLTGVTSNLSSASFGKSTNNYQPRTIQLGARIEF